MNIFKNIRSLNIYRIFEKPHTNKNFIKIILPLLENLYLEDSRSLICFTSLKSLKSLCIREMYRGIDNHDELFDSKNIRELDLSFYPCADTKILSIFPNLRRINGFTIR
jgi:hypothetical protein